MHERGITLIEIIVVVGIIGILVVGVTSFQRNVFYFGNFFQSSLEASGDAKNVLKPMMQEIRSAARSSLGGYHIEQATENEFIFYTDIDDNEYTERIRYFVENGVLKKGVTSPSGDPLTYDTSQEEVEILIRNAEVLFSYYDGTYDGDGTALSFPVSLPDVRLVEATIEIEADPNRSPEPITVSSQATIRNLKDNL